MKKIILLALITPTFAMAQMPIGTFYAKVNGEIDCIYVQESSFNDVEILTSDGSFYCDQDLKFLNNNVVLNNSLTCTSYSEESIGPFGTFNSSSYKVQGLLVTLTDSNLVDSSFRVFLQKQLSYKLDKKGLCPNLAFRSTSPTTGLNTINQEGKKGLNSRDYLERLDIKTFGDK
jgi:hypothetical protein